MYVAKAIIYVLREEDEAAYSEAAASAHLEAVGHKVQHWRALSLASQHESRSHNFLVVVLLIS